MTAPQPIEPVQATTGTTPSMPVDLALSGGPKLKVPLGYVVGFVGSLASIVELFIALKGGKPPSGWTLVALLVLPFGVMATIMVILAKQFQDQLTDAIRLHGVILGNVSRQHTTELAQQSSQIRELADNLEGEKLYQELVASVGESAHGLNAQTAKHSTGIDEDRLVELLKGSCRDFVKAFRTYGITCRLCVKQVCEDKTEQRAYVKTVCRDRGKSRDPVVHWVDQNTDFTTLMDNDVGYWMCDDVSVLPRNEYSNTSPAYSYKSVIVWPIIARDPRPQGAKISSKARAIVAFLCLDSELVGAFNEKAHVQLGWSLADAMARAYELHFLTFPLE